ncbi:GNAT family N-acetyltransferase [Methanolobus sp. WCC4]|uniref:GNAT family N-acetyltransferase n=1 Tax=Methanolobus sp. WCC4 TaxID=3125784 RepID=UPI0030F825A3
MKKTIIIRMANKADHNDVRKFIELVDEDFYPPLSKRGGGIPERIEASLDTSESNYLVAELDTPDDNEQAHRIIGMIGCTWNWKGEDTAYINFLATHPDHRRSGISKELYIRLEEILAEQGLRTIYLCTWSGNPGAKKFYEGLGYKAYSIVLNDRGNGVDTIYYKRYIPQYAKQ